MLNNIEVVKSEDVTDKKVNLGTTVMLHNLDINEKISYTLVGL